MGRIESFDRSLGRMEGDPTPEECVAADMRRAVVDVFRGNEPSTVIGYLLVNPEPSTIYDIAGKTGLSVDKVQFSVADTEAEDLAVTIRQNGLDKVARFAAFSSRNES